MKTPTNGAEATSATLASNSNEGHLSLSLSLSLSLKEFVDLGSDGI